MKPYRLKQQRMKLLAAQEASMKSANGSAEKPPLTPEQIAQQVAQQRAMAAGYAAQQRQAIATALLSGILSGLYSNPELLVDEFGDKAVNDALAFADRLQARIIADGQAKLKELEAASPAPPPKPTADLQTATPEPLKLQRPNLVQPVSDKGIGEGAAPDSRRAHGPDAGEAQAPPKGEATS